MTSLALKDDTLPLAAVLRAHWRAALLLAAMLVLFVFAGARLVLHGSGPGFDSPAGAQVSTPEAERLRARAATMSATQLRPIAPTDALAVNAAIPVESGSNPAARPFSLAGVEQADRARSLECLTAAIYYEAARETTDGQRAVAQVVLNRVRHPAYPNTVCGVVFEGARRVTGCQFSFTCDGSLRRAPMASYWERARAIAEAALGGYVHAPVGWSTHYHANYVVPYWASSLTKAAVIGTHIFYRWRGGWGRPPAFASRYARSEPVIRWRGGFGQPTAEERLAAGDATERDAAAAAAAEGAAPIGSVDSFQRAVLRRYDAPLRRDTARQLISERAEERSLTVSQRWALTGRDPQPDAPQQRPLGRWGTVPAEPRPQPGPVAAPAPRAPAAAPAPTVDAPPPASTAETAAGR
ncbi:cell wall hydrolase [Sphingosinicella terrae]|uniref:cell wall hydrolase n=1 Tax=Sphingosinicella terrae TaxID=2172047 RepID=UPI002547472E|nr:cell wall hydrolase [Sphingosinicella terrae]